MMAKNPQPLTRNPKPVFSAIKIKRLFGKEKSLGYLSYPFEKEIKRSILNP